MIFGTFPARNPRFFASFHYYNHWVAFAVLSLGATLAVAKFWNVKAINPRRLLSRRPRYDLLILACALFIWLSLPLSGSRSGMLLAIPFLFFCANHYRWAAFAKRADGAKRKKRRITPDDLETAPEQHFEEPEEEEPLRASARMRSRMAFLFVSAFAVLIGLFLIAQSKEFSGRLDQTIGQLESGSLDLRFHASPRDTAQMIAERPVWGWGLGNYQHAFWLFAGPEYRDAEGRIKMRNEFAHNDWLQFLAELGVVGFTLLIIPPVVAAWKAWRAPAGTLAPGTALAIALVLFLAAWDFPLSNPAVFLLFCVLFAISANSNRRQSPEDRAAREPKTAKESVSESPAKAG
jgi:O-antigen ligase